MIQEQNFDLNAIHQIFHAYDADFLRLIQNLIMMLKKDEFSWGM